MSELLVLLVLTVGELLGSGATPGQLAQDLEVTLLESMPVAYEELAVAVSTEQVDALSTKDQNGYRVEFYFDDVFLEPMLIDELTITVHGLQQDESGKLRIASLGFISRITADALTAGLGSHVSSLNDASVDLTKSGITLSGKYQTWVAGVPFSVSGIINIKQQTQLMFSIDKSQMVGVNIPAAVNHIIEKEVNPVYDLAAFAERSKRDIKLVYERLNYHFLLEVEEITPGDGHIIIAGKA